MPGWLTINGSCRRALFSEQPIPCQMQNRRKNHSNNCGQAALIMGNKFLVVVVGRYNWRGQCERIACDWIFSLALALALAQAQALALAAATATRATTTNGARIDADATWCLLVIKLVLKRIHSQPFSNIRHGCKINRATHNERCSKQPARERPQVYPCLMLLLPCAIISLLLLLQLPFGRARCALMMQEELGQRLGARLQATKKKMADWFRKPEPEPGQSRPKPGQASHCVCSIRHLATPTLRSRQRWQQQ